MAPVRTRIAPSPTGFLHIGTARTALFNYLFAKKYGGKFVARIEDTDLERSDKKFEEEILATLEWLGIRADESPTRGGEYGPYCSSGRLASYTPYLERLIRQGDAFYCPHSEAELEAEKKAKMAAGETSAHRCDRRDGGTEEGIIRFKTPAGRRLAFTDLIRGEISFASDLLGDFSLAKNLARPLYNFAVVVDDYEMAVSHVIRGEDLLPSTPRQLLIQEALVFPTPEYAHLPLILAADRTKFSKRHGATAVHEFREQGYLPEALVNFIALLGWNPGSDRELFSLPELIEQFDLSRVQKSGAVFNAEKLDWMNGEYIRRKSPRELMELTRPYLGEVAADPVMLERVLGLEQPRMKKLSDIATALFFFQEPDYPAELLPWKDLPAKDTAAALAEARTIVEATPPPHFKAPELERRFLEAIGGGDKGRMLWPLRAALTGLKASPGPFEVMAVLGKDETQRRIRRAIEKLDRN